MALAPSTRQRLALPVNGQGQVDELQLAAVVAVMRRLLPSMIQEALGGVTLPQPRAPEEPVNITNVKLVPGNNLVVSLSDGRDVDVGVIATAEGSAGPRGPRGQRGARGGSVNSVKLHNGRLVISYTDGLTADLGHLPLGPAGSQGPQGEPGRSVSAVQRTGDKIELLMSDGDIVPLGDLPRGPKGERGDQGQVGARGDVGPEGNQGPPGPRGEQGPAGPVGPTGPCGTSIVEMERIGNSLRVAYDDGRSTELGELPVGIQGPCGERGLDGRSGTDGAPGPQGPQGEMGPVGPPGNPGVSVERVFRDGDALAVEYSSGRTTNLGPLPQGRDGADGERGPTGIGIADIYSADGRCCITLSDDRTIELDLPHGEPGPEGQAGTGISELTIDDAGSLIVSLDDGTERVLGRVVGRDGKDGETPDLAGIVLSEAAKDQLRQFVFESNKANQARINEHGVLELVLAGELYQLGRVVGRDGESFRGAALSEHGELLLHLTDRASGMLETINLGRVVGRDGLDGSRGPRGDRGFAGRSLQSADLIDGRFILNYDDGNKQDLGSITGPAGAGFTWSGKYKRSRKYYSQTDNPAGPFADVVSYKGSVWVCNTATTLAPPGNGWDKMFAEKDDDADG